jgi:phosphoribosylformimino-5-aminoimidazole carboxamide ribotide isomerase
VDAGATWLHVVDLDGARAGEPVALEQLRRIAGELHTPVQYGGGLRTLDAVEAAVAAGARRVVLGTAALNDPDLLAAALTNWPDHVVVAVDTRGGRVASGGWLATTQLTVEEVIERMQDRGVRRLAYTDVDRDGMLSGADLERVRALAHDARASLIYSGGIGSLEDLRGLAALREPTLTGVIVGKALYERRFTIAQAQEALADT